MKKQCVDCCQELTGHGHPLRCYSCAARARYIKKYGTPASVLIAKCTACDKEFTDYASNRRKTKHGELFCSAKCRAVWTGIRNSITRGGEGKQRTISEKAVLYYRSGKTAERIRGRARKYYWKNRDRILMRKKESSRTLKQEIVAAYGGHCQCCRESYLEFLTIDHVNGDGGQHRKLLGKGRKIYEDLKRRGFPQEAYRLLCLNCNITLGFYGYCPHRPTEGRQVNHSPLRAGRSRTVA